MPKFNTMFDIAFEVEHDYDLSEEIHAELIIFALEKRLMEIKQRVMEGDREGIVGEVFGICNTYKIPQTIAVVIGLGCGDQSNRFFAAMDNGHDDDLYFHKDLSFHHSTFNDTTQKFDGYWESREELEKSLREKFPDVLISDFTD